MPIPVPHVLLTEAGSPVAVGCPRTHTMLHEAEVPLQTIPSHPHLPNAPINSLHRCPPDCDAPINDPPLTWYTFISISDAPFGGSICWVLVTGPPKSSSVPIFLAMAFMAGCKMSVLEPPRHAYFINSFHKLLCLHLLTLDLSFLFLPLPLFLTCAEYA